MTNPYKILIVDDDNIQKYAMKKLIKELIAELKLCWEVIDGSDGVDAITTYIEDRKNARSLKLIVTDESMPFLNGSDAVKLIRQIEKNNNYEGIKVLSVISDCEENNSNMIIDSGSNYVLVRPITKDNLNFVFRRMMTIQ